jgi:hypothetical protein
MNVYKLIADSACPEVQAMYEKGLINIIEVINCSPAIPLNPLQSKVIALCAVLPPAILRCLTTDKMLEIEQDYLFLAQWK